MNELTTTAPEPITYPSEIQRDPRLRSPHTRRLYTAALEHFETWRAARPLTKTLVEEYLALLQRDLSSSTVNARLAAIRWWARRVADLAFEMGTSEESERVGHLAARITSVRDVKGERVPAGRHLEQSEIESLLDSCKADPTPAGIRDGALIALACATGARSDELLHIQLADITYTQDGAEVLIKKGKGNKQRTAYLFGATLRALDAWLDVRGATEGYVITRILKNGKVLLGEPVSYETLRRILKKRYRASSMTRTTTWHNFRRTFIGQLLDNGADIATVQALAGHASPTTTSRYDRRPDDRKRTAAKSIEVPYK